jgi:hypothetical protein
VAERRGSRANVSVRQCPSACVLTLLGVSAVRAEILAEDDTCGNVETDIATDRPDVTNGINWTDRVFRFLACDKTSIVQIARTAESQSNLRLRWRLPNDAHTADRFSRGNGLNRALPELLFGVGYSLRFDNAC